MSVLVGFISTYNIDLVNVEDGKTLLESLDSEIQSEEIELNILNRTVDALTVSDFKDLLSKDNIIALIVFSLIFGISINMSKEKSKPLIQLLESANVVIMNIIKIIMYYAPIGICCYFAALIGTFGSSIAVGYLKTFVIY